MALLRCPRSKKLLYRGSCLEKRRATVAEFPKPAGADQRVLVTIQYRTGDVDAWRCADAMLCKNSRVLHLSNAATLLEDGGVLRFANAYVAVDAVVLWTKDVDRG
jgi:hypothetical protein